MADDASLYLFVQPFGALLWRYRHRSCGVEPKLSLGTFSKVSLAQARRELDEDKGEFDDRINPLEEKRQRRIKAELAA